MEVGEKGIVLKDHSGLPFIGRKMINTLVAEKDLARVRRGESCNHPEEGRFPATAGAEEGEKLPLFDQEADPVKSPQGSKRFGDSV